MGSPGSLSDVHHERVGDGDGQRQTDLKRGAAPRSVSHLDLPPSRLTFERTTSMPTPRPAAVVTEVAVVRPGREDQVENVALAESRQGLGRDEAAAPRASARPPRRCPGRSSATSM